MKGIKEMNEVLNELKKGSQDNVHVVEATTTEQKAPASERASSSKRGISSHRGEGSIVRESSGDTKKTKKERQEREQRNE